MYSLVTKRAKGAQSSMVEVTYSYDHVTQYQTLVERRWILPHPSRKPVFAGSFDDLTPFGGSGDTLKRKKVLGSSLRVFFEPSVEPESGETSSSASESPEPKE
ncbi:hypothetical protein CJU89_4631 [Yarrowia sp. B02]|nr:hypothetical protein CJU89_4631 [Yarrowia sp. B02]